MSMVGEDPKQGETPQAWAKDVPLCGPDAPQDNGRLKWLLEYMLTIYDRFGDTAVTFDGSWGAAALHVKDKEKTIIARLERELAQMAAQKAEAQRDAERYRWLRDNGKLKTWEGLTYWTKDERTFETAIDTALAAERKEEKQHG